MTTVPTAGEEFSKLLHHIDECRNCASMLMHLYKEQGSSKDLALSKGWFVIAENFKLQRAYIVEMAKGKLQ